MLARSHEDATIERFQKDSELAAEYLDAIIKEGDEGELLQALQRMSKAFGEVGEIVDRAELNAKSFIVRFPPRAIPK